MKWITRIAIGAIVLVAVLAVLVYIFRGGRQTANTDATATKTTGHSGTAEQPTSIQELKQNSKKYLISCIGTHIRIPWGTPFQIVAVRPSSNRDYTEVVCAFSKETTMNAHIGVVGADSNNFGLLLIRIKNFQSIGGSDTDFCTLQTGIFEDPNKFPRDFILCIKEEFRGQGSRVVWDILDGATKGPLVLITDGSLLNIQKGVRVNVQRRDVTLLDLPSIP